MLNINDFYNHFIETNRKRIELICNDIKKLVEHKKKYVKFLSVYEAAIREIGNFQYDYLVKTLSPKIVNFEFTNGEVIPEVEIIIRVLAEINAKLREDFRLLKRYDFPYGLTLPEQNRNRQVYNHVITQFNKLIIDEIIDGYTYLLGNRCGSIKAIRQKNSGTISHTGKLKHLIDWGESTKKKNRLIAEGRIPYHSTDRPHGEDWFVYFDKEPYLLLYFWTRARSTNANIFGYKFTPCIPMHTKLYHINNADEEHQLKYPTYDKED